MGMQFKIIFALFVIVGGKAAQAQVLGEKEAFKIEYAPIFIALIVSLLISAIVAIAVKYCMSGKTEFRKIFTNSKGWVGVNKRICVLEVRKLTSSSSVGLVQLDGVEFFVFLNEAATPKLLPAKRLSDERDEGEV